MARLGRGYAVPAHYGRPPVVGPASGAIDAGTVTLAGAGSLSSAAVVTELGAASLSGAGSLAADGLVGALGSPPRPVRATRQAVARSFNY